MSTWKESIKDLAHGNWSLGNWGKRSPRDGDAHPLSQLQRQLNSVFDDFLSGWGGDGAFGSKGFMPKISVSESSDQIMVSAELPGLEQKDVELTLTPEALTIRGEKREERESESSPHVYTMERSYGSFQRSIPLTCEVDTDKVDAVFKNGVLSVALAKTPAAQAKSKKIAIHG